MGKIIYKQLQDKEWLTEKYLDGGNTMKQIASMVGTHPCVVLDALRKHGIKSRSAYGHIKGKKFSIEHRTKLSEAQTNKPKYWMVGENNPNWDGGKTKGIQMERTTVKYKVWKKSVFDRDIFCVNCGSTSQRVAHHIKPYHEFPELRFDVDNGVVLCRSCHSKYHLALNAKGFNSANTPTVGNAEPAEEIAKGSSGVCNDQA